MIILKLLHKLGIHFHTIKITDKKGVEETEVVDFYWVRFWKKCKFCDDVKEYERLR